VTWNTLNTKSLREIVSDRMSLREILMSRELASLGDAYLNLMYSTALSLKKGRPEGRKMDRSTLSQSLKNAGMRRIMPNRVDRHTQADAVEALMAYAWLRGLMSFEEGVTILLNGIEEPVSAITHLINQVKARL